MLTVEQARAQGWQLIIPLERMTSDKDVVLMRHERTDGRLELGLARLTQAEERV